MTAFGCGTCSMLRKKYVHLLQIENEHIWTLTGS